MQKRVGEGAGGKRGRETAERGFKGGGGGQNSSEKGEDRKSEWAEVCQVGL